MEEKDAAQTEATGAEDRTKELMDKVKGHDSVVIEDGDGNEWTLRYPRRLIKQMEERGVTSAAMADLLAKATLTSTEKFIEDFVLPAFKTDQPKMKLADVIDIYEALPDKNDFVTILIALFNQAMLSLTTDPTETRMKFRLA